MKYPKDYAIIDGRFVYRDEAGRLIVPVNEVFYGPDEWIPLEEAEYLVVGCDSDETGYHYSYAWVRKVYGPRAPLAVHQYVPF